jgi:hypothetical protein
MERDHSVPAIISHESISGLDPAGYLTSPAVFQIEVSENETVESIRFLKSHATFDGSSEDLLWKRLDAILNGGKIPPIIDGSFFANMEMQFESWSSGEWSPISRHWSELGKGLPHLKFPTDKGLSIWPTRRMLLRKFSHQESLAVRRTTEACGVTPFALLSSALAYAMAEVFGWDTVPFVTLSANRFPAGSRYSIGQYMNPVLMPLQPTSDKRTNAFRAMAAVSEVADLGRYPFFLLLSEQPEVAETLRRSSIVGIRDALGGTPQSGKVLCWWNEDFASNDPALDFGLGFDILADLFLRSDLGIKITYRSDKISSGLASSVIDAAFEYVNSASAEL